MSNSGISTDLEHFIDRHINSVAQMEVLLLLCRESGRTWTAQEVAHALYIQPEAALAYLIELREGGCCIGFDQASSKFQYDPSSPSLHRLVGELASNYKTRSVAVIKQIFSKPPEHLRRFSEAFLIKQDDTPKED